MTHSLAVIDIESYPDFFLAVILNEAGESKTFAASGEDATLTAEQSTTIVELLRDADRHVTFNGTRYDLPLLRMAVKGESVRGLYRESSAIINVPKGGKPRHWRDSDVEVKHIDLMDLSPRASGGLKGLGARMHVPDITELPYDPTLPLQSTEKEAKLTEYCVNDCQITLALYQHVHESVALRDYLNAQPDKPPKVNFLHLRDSQFAERLLEHRLPAARALRTQIRKRKNPPPPTRVGYRPPTWLQFETPELQRQLHRFTAAEYGIVTSGGYRAGKPELPKTLDAFRHLDVYEKRYEMGIGGLHSKFPFVYSFTAADEAQGKVCREYDVASYYPHIILQSDMEPFEGFRDEYQSMVDQRLDAKAAGETHRANALKIAINSVYGKLSQHGSSLYKPELALHTTLTGQFALLKLIEDIGDVPNVEILQANTDGIVVMGDKDVMDTTIEARVQAWSETTQLHTETTEYERFLQLNCNEYVAFMPDGTTKDKGGLLVQNGNISHQPAFDIVRTAVHNYYRDGTPLRDTVYGCEDLRPFLKQCYSVAGFEKVNTDTSVQPLGSVIRAYETDSIPDEIRKRNTNRGLLATDPLRATYRSLIHPKVAITLARDDAGKVPVPGDLDRDAYVEKACLLCTNELRDHAVEVQFPSPKHGVFALTQNVEAVDIDEDDEFIPNGV